MRATSRTAALIPIIAAAWLLVRDATAAPERLEGVFINPDQSEEPIKTAIEAAVRDFSFLTRPFARNRLRTDNPAIKRVAIAHADKVVTITLGPSQPNTTEPGRSTVKWTRPDGEVFDVSTEWQGATLVQIFVASYGRRVNRYVLAPDGANLIMHVTITSSQLKTPVQYQLNFKREAAR